MIYGIGSDIVAVPRMQRLLERYGDNLARRILAPGEWEAYRGAQNRAGLLAKRFAAKEAFAKAVGTGLRSPVSLANISIAHTPLGQPHFHFSPELVELLDSKGIRRHHLSLSDEREMACAFVVLEE